MSDDDIPEPLSFAKHRIAQAIQNMRSPTTGSNPSIKHVNPDAACQHDGTVSVDFATRTIQCETCHAIIDPFDFVAITLRRERHIDHMHTRLMKDREMQRGFYEAKRTERVKSCRHTRTFNIDGGKKCLKCDTFLPTSAPLTTSSAGTGTSPPAPSPPG